VGPQVNTTNGPGKVAKSSGKGWVVVETDNGGSYRMRLSQLWDYLITPKVEGNGYALALPAQRAGDPGMPKNWSFSLLKKRVQTNQGIGVVMDVIDKGWIGVRLDTGRKIKTRPGNVTALEGDDVILTFAKKTKATHAIKPPILLHNQSDIQQKKMSKVFVARPPNVDGEDEYQEADGDDEDDDEDISENGGDSDDSISSTSASAALAYMRLQQPQAAVIPTESSNYYEHHQRMSLSIGTNVEIQLYNHNR